MPVYQTISLPSFCICSLIITYVCRWNIPNNSLFSIPILLYADGVFIKCFWVGQGCSRFGQLVFSLKLWGIWHQSISRKDQNLIYGRCGGNGRASGIQRSIYLHKIWKIIPDSNERNVNGLEAWSRLWILPLPCSRLGFKNLVLDLVTKVHIKARWFFFSNSSSKWIKRNFWEIQRHSC